MGLESAKGLSRRDFFKIVTVGSLMGSSLAIDMYDRLRVTNTRWYDYRNLEIHAETYFPSIDYQLLSPLLRRFGVKSSSQINIIHGVDYPARLQWAMGLDQIHLLEVNLLDNEFRHDPQATGSSIDEYLNLLALAPPQVGLALDLKTDASVDTSNYVLHKIPERVVRIGADVFSSPQQDARVQPHKLLKLIRESKPLISSPSWGIASYSTQYSETMMAEMLAALDYFPGLKAIPIRADLLSTSWSGVERLLKRRDTLINLWQNSPLSTQDMEFIMQNLPASRALFDVAEATFFSELLYQAQVDEALSFLRKQQSAV